MVHRIFTFILQYIKIPLTIINIVKFENKIYQSNRFQKNILNKFNTKLKQLCIDENIKLTYHPDEETKNAGLYIYIKKKELRKEHELKYPKIKIYTKRNNMLVLAHEIGHHYGVTDFDDTSEEFADNYIATLAKRYLNDYELLLCKITFEVYSNTKLSLNKDEIKKYRIRIIENQLEKKYIRNKIIRNKIINGVLSNELSFFNL